MGRWKRFWWAFGQAWKFATDQAKIRTLTRQIKNGFHRTLIEEYAREYGVGR